eukprot:3935499-Rhodomonas_salina.2
MSVTSLIATATNTPPRNDGRAPQSLITLMCHAVSDHIVCRARHQLQLLSANLEANVVPTHVDVLGPLAEHRLAGQKNAGR